MSAFETKQQARGRWRRWVGRLLLAGFMVLCVAAIAGATYEFVSDRRDARRFPQEGRSVEVGGFWVNIHCTTSGCTRPHPMAGIPKPLSRMTTGPPSPASEVAGLVLVDPSQEDEHTPSPASMTASEKKEDAEASRRDRRVIAPLEFLQHHRV